MEIERKFLVREIPEDAAQAPASAIVQGYLATGPDAEVRLRRSNERCLLTVKGQGSLTRVEEEFEIGRDRYESLWPLTGERRSRSYAAASPTGTR